VSQTSKGNYPTHDNRRLYAFQQAEAVQTVPVNVTSARVPDFKMSREPGSRTVEVRK